MSSAQTPDGYLFDLYRKYVGEPEGRNDVYVGFGLFFGGIAVAVVALALFLWGSTYEAHTTTYYAWIQPGYALGLLSLPAMMLGIVVLLPSERRMLVTSIAGFAITAGAVMGFVYAYPNHWHFVRDVDYTVEVVAAYAVGSAGLIASTGAALVAHYLELARSAGIADDPSDEDDDGDSYTDEEIRDDIDAAMEDVELSWGGVQKTEHKRLSFTEDEFDDVSVGSAATKTRSTGVDAQVAGLKGLKGGDKKTETSTSTVDDQTAKLNELREQRRESEPADETGLLGRVRESVRETVDRLRD